MKQNSPFFPLYQLKEKLKAIEKRISSEKLSLAERIELEDQYEDLYEQILELSYELNNSSLQKSAV
jgi:hypothetical protein